MSSISGGINQVVVGATYNTVLPSGSEGQFIPLVCDSNGRLVSAPSWEWSSFTAFNVVSGNAFVGLSHWKGLYCRNDNAAVRYIQLFNSAIAPVANAVPAVSIRILGASTITVDGAVLFGDNGRKFTTGISFGFSTTEATFTAGTATNHSIHLSYRSG